MSRIAIRLDKGCKTFVVPVSNYPNTVRKVRWLTTDHGVQAWYTNMDFSRKALKLLLILTTEYVKLFTTAN